MINLTQLRSNIYQLFNIMRDTELYVDVSHNGRAYRIWVEDLKMKVPDYRKKSLVDKVEADRCKACGRLEMNGVCTDINCPSNKKSQAS